MKRSLSRQIKWNYLALAFALPVLGILVMQLIRGFSPFGNSSMLYSDMYHQYYPFFVSFRRALLSGESLLYNWDVGLGMDYLGLIAYYLASPLNLLSIFVPEGWLLGYFSLLMPIKLGLASLFFALFLKKLFGRNDFSITLFGMFYGMCAWALGYQWNIMWLDTFALLPLVVLGTVSLLRDKKFVLYTLSLFGAVCTNYYVGFFVCIFVALIFLCYEICRWQGFKRFFQDLCRIAVFSVLALAMTAFLELPAFAALQTTYSSVNNFPQGFRLNIAGENTLKGMFDAMRQVAGNMAGGILHTHKEGLPNLYCGIASVMLAVLYLMARDVKLRDKICCVVLLVFFNLSFIIRQLDYIWHGFHFTNMIPYRFSFLYSFVVLYMAYQAWLRRDAFRPWQSIMAAAVSLGLFLCSNDRGKPIFLVVNLSFLAMYLGSFLYAQWPGRTDADEKKRKAAAARWNARRVTATVFLLTFLASELVVNLANLGIRFTGTNISNYPKDTAYSASMIRYMHEREEDTLFYRAETTHSQTLNDGALNNYRGISTFTSSANVKVTEFMKALGYGAKNNYNRYCYEEASPVSNLFLGIKYMIERDGKDKQSAYFTDLHHYGSTHLLENNAYLPLGFLADPKLGTLEFGENANVFRFQNKLFTAATGITEAVWWMFGGDDLVITGDNVTVTDENSSGYCAYSKGVANSAVTYTYTAHQDGFMCVNLNLPKRNKVSISVNGVELYSETMSLPQMLAVGDVSVGDEITVRMTCKANESGTMSLSAAILNQERFFRGYAFLAENTWELTSFHNTRIAGTVDCSRDGLLYTSVPQNGNWHAYVDGKEVPITLVGDAMVAVELTQGTHTVTLVYRNTAFILGTMISLVSAAAFIGAYLLVYKPKTLKKIRKTEER